MDEYKAQYDFLKPNIWVLIGLIFAALALVTFFLAAFRFKLDLGSWGLYSFGEPCVIFILLGGLFLLIGGNAKYERA
jgi:hypothetical protein